MAALTFDALLRTLKKRAPDPVYFLYGDEDVLKQDAIQALVAAALEPGARDFNLDSRFAADLDAESFHALVNTLPLLAERRVVIVRAVEQVGKRKSKVREALLRYLASPSPSTVLVLVTSAGEEPDAEVSRDATRVEVGPLAPERVPGWIAHYAKREALELAPDAVELLIQAVGADLGALSRELDKLGALSADRSGRAITAADVSALVGVRRGETVDDLVAAALERRAAAAARLVEPVLEQAGMSGVKILALLGTHLIGTTLARGERDRAPGKTPDARVESAVYQLLLAARPHGVRGYREEAARWTRWSARWSEAELRAALRAALAADQALKSTTVSDDRGILMQLVLGFAAVAREAA